MTGSGGFGVSGGDPTLAGVDDSAATLGPEGSATDAGRTRGGSGTYGGDEAPQPGDLIGNFVVQRMLGAGAMGVVVLALDPELDRPVAIKLLAPHYGGGDVARQRLVREAQAVARLSHPNVIAVHQVGTHGQRVYMVMEFVDGGTLGQWVRAQPRSVAEIVGVYRQAAQGLAAAHAAGLVHRDFKPDNALIGSDGRVRVSDFGLVAPTGTETGPTGTINSEADARLTQTGVLLGTPAYMAPEQFAGQAVDARADQFALCVALFEALHGVRPYGGDNVGQLYAAITTGKLEPARRADVPASLQGAIVRGLSENPNARHASMEALAAALDVPRRHARRGPPVAAVVAAAVGVLGVAGGITAWALWRGDDAPAADVTAAAVPLDAGTPVDPGAGCPAPRTQWPTYWDDERRDVLRGAFAATGYAAAGPLAERVVSRADGYLARSEQGRHQACRDRAGADTDADALSDEAKQAVCFDSHQDALAGIADGLVDRPTVERIHVALDLLDSMPRVERCNDRDAVASEPAAPTDEQRPLVRDVRRKLWRIVLSMQAGENDETDKLARDARLAADEAGYAPLDAEVQSVEGTLLMVKGQRDEAEVMLRAAVKTAKRAEHPAAEADATIGLVRAVGHEPTRIPEALLLVGEAHDAIERAHASHVRWALDTSAAALYEATGRYVDAESSYTRALQSLDELDPVPQTDRAHVLARRAATLARLMRTDEAIADYESSLAGYTEALGEVHPLRVGTLVGYASLLMQLGKSADARTQIEQAKRALETAGRDLEYGVEVHWTHSQIEEQLGNVSTAVDAARAAVRAHEIRASRRVPEWMLRQRLGYLLVLDDEGAEADRQLELALDHMDVAGMPAQVADVVALRGRASYVQGDYRQAAERFAAALRLRERALGKYHALVASAHVALGEMEMLRGDCERAFDSFDAALEVRAKIGALPDLDLAKIHLGEADCALQEHHITQGSDALEDAEDVLAHHALGDDIKARANFVRAKLRWAEHDFEGAHEDASKARDSLERLGSPYARDKQIVVDWLAAHPK